MKFEIRWIGGINSYQDVVVTYGNTRIELGLLNEVQRRQLAESMQSAIDELLRDLPDD